MFYFSATTPETQTINNQDTNTIRYSGNWTPKKSIKGVPSKQDTAPFHTTSNSGDSASLQFSGRAVAVYGLSTIGNGQYKIVRIEKLCYMSS